MRNQESGKEKPQENTPQEEAGKYLTFVLGEEEYGLEILKVREIIGMTDVTKVPQMPLHVKGVINLRGTVIPVIGLRPRFGMEEIPYTAETCIIVVDVNNIQMGIIVDSVSEVLDIAATDIEDAPSFGTNVDTNFILGMGKAKGSVKILLAIDEVLREDELS